MYMYTYACIYIYTHIILHKLAKLETMGYLLVESKYAGA